METDPEVQADLAGIKGAIAAGKQGKGKGKARARGGDDWDIEGDAAPLAGREELPVLVTLNLVGEREFLDATLREEAACPARVHVFVRPSGRIAGIRMEGDGGIGTERIRPLLEVSSDVYQELTAGSTPDRSRARAGAQRRPPIARRIDASILLGYEVWLREGLYIAALSLRFVVGRGLVVRLRGRMLDADGLWVFGSCLSSRRPLASSTCLGDYGVATPCLCGNLLLGRLGLSRLGTFAHLTRRLGHPRLDDRAEHALPSVGTLGHHERVKLVDL
jgi:hypothetical protein